MKKYIEKVHAKISKGTWINDKVYFSNIKKYDVDLIKSFNEINLIFSYILAKKRPDLLTYTPYEVKILLLKAKNQWTQGHYVAIDKPNGTLNLYLAFNKLKKLEKFPIYALVWVLFHEFRHKVQAHDEIIGSVINCPNWNNYKKYLQEKTGKDENLINHILHELNPAEVDANIFASEMTGIKFNGNSFNITEESLKLLE